MPITLSAINLKRSVTSALDDYRNKPGAFALDYVAPYVDSPTKSGHMPKFSRAHMKLQDFEVALDGTAHKIDIGTEKTDYTCKDHSAEAMLTKRMIASDTSGLIKGNNIAVRADEAMRLSRENVLATALLALSGTNPGTKWNATGGNAVKDIATQQGTIFGLINRIPMFGLCPVAVALQLRVQLALANGRQKTDLPSMAEVAAWLGLTEIRVAMAQYDSAKPEKTVSMASLYGSTGFWLFHKPEVMDSSLPAFMATPRFQALSKPRVYNTSQPDGFGIEVNDCSVVKSIDTNACYYSTNVI